MSPCEGQGHTVRAPVHLDVSIFTSTDQTMCSLSADWMAGPVYSRLADWQISAATKPTLVGNMSILVMQQPPLLQNKTKGDNRGSCYTGKL